MSNEPIVALMFPNFRTVHPEPPCGCDWRGCPDCYPENFTDDDRANR
jgi:hypothetical protein